MNQCILILSLFHSCVYFSPCESVHFSALLGLRRRHLSQAINTLVYPPEPEWQPAACWFHPQPILGQETAEIRGRLEGRAFDFVMEASVFNYSPDGEMGWEVCWD